MNVLQQLIQLFVDHLIGFLIVCLVAAAVLIMFLLSRLNRPPEGHLVTVDLSAPVKIIEHENVFDELRADWTTNHDFRKWTPSLSLAKISEISYLHTAGSPKFDEEKNPVDQFGALGFSSVYTITSPLHSQVAFVLDL